MKLYNPRPEPPEEKTPPKSNKWLLVHTIILMATGVGNYWFMGYLRINSTFMAEYSDDVYQRARIMAAIGGFLMAEGIMYYWEYWRHRK